MQLDSEIGKPKMLRWLEHVLLMVCLCVLALRVTYAENPHIVQLNTPGRILGNDGFSLIISTVLILSAIIWCIGAFVCGKLSYRFSGIETGLVIFFVAAIVGIFVASDKRAAITDLVTLMGPMLMALLLIQILDSPAKIKLVLFVVVALGAAGSFQCFDQLFATNQYMIEDYERDPEDHLLRAGFEPNSFQHMLYEHRLYSKDIRGFLTTSNSAGSFAILATFAAVALFIEKFKHRAKENSYTSLMCCGIVAVVVTAGLIVTQSKGALVATAISAGFLIAYLAFGRWLLAHRKAVFIICLLVVAVGLAVVVMYGVSCGRLPGGNSMLVRWQYWASAARMYADRPLRGVGGGNFGTYYSYYKPASALETVRDPHNFVLTLLTQYGPLGLIGFVMAFGVVLYRTVFVAATAEPTASRANDKSFRALAGAGLVAILVTLLASRPIVMAEKLGEDFMVIVSVILTLYIVPAVVFSIAFLFLWLSEEKYPTAGHPPGAVSRAIIFCGIVAVLIHNLVDFAIFEPGVLTCFWVMIACLAVIDSESSGRRVFILSPNLIMRITAIAVAVVITWAHCHYVLVPAIKASSSVQRAMRNLIHARRVLEQAAEDDKLSPVALNLNGKLHLQHYNETPHRQPAMLKQAAQYFKEALGRDKANFKNFEKLMIVYELLARVLPDEAQEWDQKAYDAGLEAAKRYPGRGKLQVELGKIAERLGNNKIALSHYKEAVAIEESYRVQYRLMYPDREMFSRLGQKKYQFAKERIARLSE
jgi:hypothetical protein